MTEILFDKERAPYTFHALKHLLLDYSGWTAVRIGTSSSGSREAVRIGLAFWHGADDGCSFYSAMRDLLAKGCSRFLLFSPTAGAVRPWHTLPPLQQRAFRESVPVCTEPDGVALINALQAVGDPPKWAIRRIEDTIDARHLYRQLLKFYGHTSKTDLSNQFLAPARVLLMDGNCGPLIETELEVWRSHWVHFERDVLSQLGTKFGRVGSEVDAVAGPIREWVNQKRVCSSLDVAVLLELLTNCRIVSGERTDAESRMPRAKKPKDEEPLASVNRRGDVARLSVLVVDDHAAAWRPVFKAVQERLGKEHTSAAFDFSVDGDWVCRGNGARVPLLQVVPEYDIVLLDIFIGEKDGRRILQRIRDTYRGIPVLLWTTSRDQEITRHIPLANGLILKKTTSLDDVASVIAKWGQEGKNRRLVSLPNPLFDDVIRQGEYRKLIRDMTEWCLKQMDSFHALDGTFFRFFTDHGGRHFVKLLELLEHALRPFLSGTELLPEDLDERETTFVALYLAVISHELGMFPVCMAAPLEDFGQLSKDNLNYLYDVRTLHSLRGMALLDSDPATGGMWPDSAGQKLALQMDEASVSGRIQLRKLLAVVVGYHARFLKSLERDEEFLVWTEAAERKFRDSVKSTSPIPESYRNVFNSCLRNLRQHFASGGDRDRIRKLCALFRFVDAIDISASRNPARFLILSHRRSAKNNREHLKRELCADIGIFAGEVRAWMNALPPDAEDVRSVIKHGCILLGEDSNGVEMPTASEIQFPWAGKVSAKRYQDALDEWLLEFWNTVMRHHTTTTFVEHLRTLGVISGEVSRLGVTTKGRTLVAGITALSVAGEVLDEYGAIIETGLEDRLRLGQFNWSDATWDVNSMPSILGEGLAQYIEDPSPA